jgi:MSHA biogenesis protein MshP
VFICKKGQQGFLIPVAIFIVAGLSLLAISITRLSTQSGASSFREGLSAQAFYAAESSVQYAMNQVLFPNATRATADTACVAINGSSLSFSVSGLNQCQSDISCSSSTNASNTISYYSVQSLASCGSGDLTVEREISGVVYLE